MAQTPTAATVARTATIPIIAGLGAALSAAVCALAALPSLVEARPPRLVPHWINVPSNLRQMNDDDTPLDVREAAGARAVWLGASSESQPFNRCDWWYRLEVEVRRAGDAFTFAPTHIGEWVSRSTSKRPLSYPLVRVEALKPRTRYRWIARERVQPFTSVSDRGGGRCEAGALRESRWAWHHVPFEYSFRTP